MNMQEDCNTKKVIICIPIYKTTLSPFEEAAIRQLNKVLGKYPRVFIAPESLSFDFDIVGKDIGVERFPDYYFSSIISYSYLLLTREFYQRFLDYKFMLIYQTDAFVFTDKLQEFCDLDYDYMGAPMEGTDAIWRFISGRVGNGGLSLRKISSALRMLDHWPTMVRGTIFESLFRQWEDLYWGFCSQKDTLNFRVPDIHTALAFAVQGNVGHAYKRMKNGWRPFGCHGWWQMEFAFWRPIIEGYGYSFNGEKNTVRNRYTRLQDYLLTRNSVNIYYLLGLYRKGKLSKLQSKLSSWLVHYNDQKQSWQLNMEPIIYLWRLMEYDNRLKNKQNDKRTLQCRLTLAQALINALKDGVRYPICWNLLIGMIPYLALYDYSVYKNLTDLILTKWWIMWTKASPKRPAIYNSISTSRKIVVLSEVRDEYDLVESFIRHTLTFADAVLMDISVATDTVKVILQSMVKEKLPLILHDKVLHIADFQEDVDFVINLSVGDFLLPQTQGGDVRRILEGLPTDNYVVEIGMYAHYLPYAYNDKFSLLRPLLKKHTAASYVQIIYGSGSKETLQQKNAVDLYLVKFYEPEEGEPLRGVIPADTEITDLSPFVSGHELYYTPAKAGCRFREMR